MRKIFNVFLIVSLVFGMSVSTLDAADSEGPIEVKCEVPILAPKVAIAIYRFPGTAEEPWTYFTEENEVTVMDFGLLTDELATGAGAGVFFSEVGHVIFVYAQGYGQQYEIASSHDSGLVGPGATLPEGSFGLAPWYAPEDKWIWPGNEAGTPQGPMPTGAKLGDPTPAKGTDKLIYQSEPAPSTPRIIQTYYAIPPYTKPGEGVNNGNTPWLGYVPVPLNQKAGLYEGTVTITITP